jgi:class 3 adenylate cyclase
MYLFILSGSKEGYRFTITPGILVVGRSSEADISLPNDRYVSGTHAELHMDESGKLTLLDRGSRNGTFLAGEIIHEAREVKPGDIIQIGRTFFKYSRRAAERYFIQEPVMESNPEAILVIDMVGSSRIAQAMGDRVADKVKNILLEKLNDNLKKYPAEFLKNTGDGFMIILGSAKNAIKLATDLLADLRVDESNRGIHIRMGIHYGETSILPDGDRRGLAVDMAFRVESVKVDDMHQTAVGIKKDMLPRIDRIFITEVVHHMIASDSMIKTRCIGYFDLKGFTGRHKIFEIFT